MKQTNKTLVILTPGFAANESDSTCLPAQQIFINALNKNFPFLKIIIVSFQYPFVSSTYQWKGNTVISLNGKNKGKFLRLITWLRAWRKLQKINQENNVIGLLSFWCTECALIGSYFAKRNKMQHYSWILGQDARPKNKFIKWIKPNAENLVAMSDFIAEEFYKNYLIKPTHVVTNGIDAALFKINNKEKIIDVLGAGSLIPLKQYDIFINIINELKKEIPAINAMVCGKGMEENNMISQINKFHLQKNITLAGEKPHDEILNLMCTCKIFLHTSSYEGFSTVCLEALYAGAHVISFCKPMNAEIKNWHIVKNEKEMKDVALKLLTDSKTTYENVLPFTMDNSANKMMLLFNINTSV